MEALPWHDTGSAETYTEVELYDLHADPYELNNLIGYQSHQPLLEVMRKRLTARMLEAGEAAPEIIPAPVVVSGQRVLYEKEWNL
jgi:hypothetical protein